jgi:ferritin-like metal-binding protein YciE
MVGLVMEASQAIDADADPRVRDAAILAAAQRIQHYKIAGYGCAAAFAELLDEQQAADQLRATLGEEKEADEALSQLARGSINIEAAGGSEEMEPHHEADAGRASRR